MNRVQLLRPLVKTSLKAFCTCEGFLKTHSGLKISYILFLKLRYGVTLLLVKN